MGIGIFPPDNKLYHLANITYEGEDVEVRIDAELMGDQEQAVKIFAQFLFAMSTSPGVLHDAEHVRIAKAWFKPFEEEDNSPLWMWSPYLVVKSYDGTTQEMVYDIDLGEFVSPDFVSSWHEEKDE